LPPAQVEYKLRRMVNDYLQPPKVTKKMEIGLARFEAIRADLDRMSASNPHELMRAMEVHAIRDCAELAARASLYRKESRWGLYHNRVDYPERNDAEWFVHVQVAKVNGEMTCFKRPVAPYIVSLDEQERNAYQQLRINKEAAPAEPALAE
jgi:succinate dehydrogenase/fumarate reductase flavoprotein subunit